MSVSGSVDYNLTATEIVEAAFAVLGVAQEGETMTARMLSDGLRALNLMLKTWGTNEHLWLKTDGTVTMVASQAAYTLSSPKPMRVLDVTRVTSDGIETPLNELSWREYSDLPNKTGSPSIPVSYYYDPQLSTGTLYLWPAPSSTTVADFTMDMTYLRRISDMDASNNDLDMPQEWLETVQWNLAKRLMTQYPVNDPNLAQMVIATAVELLDQLRGWDNETASIYLQPA